MKMVYGTVLGVVGETAGIVGTDELGPTVPKTGDTLGVGTAVAALTPRLPISVDPNGIPARAPLVGVDDVDVGLDDAAMLPEPEPHMPVNPDVSGIPDDVDNPDVAEIAVDVDIPDDGVPPDIPPVAGVEVPFAIPIPPPS